MKKLSEVLSLNSDKSALIRAVINHIGIVNVQPVISFGPDAGFPGFIYPHDTSKFYRRHRESINTLIHETHHPSEVSVVNFVCDYLNLEAADVAICYNDMAKCLGDSTLPEIRRESTLSEIGMERTQHYLALFALEAVCRLFQ